MKIQFDDSEMKRALRTWGYQVRKTKTQQARSVGPGNDVEYHTYMKHSVFHGGKIVSKAEDYNNPIEEVFEKEFKRRLWELIK
jgi:hypothetical protein